MKRVDIRGADVEIDYETGILTVRPNVKGWTAEAKAARRKRAREWNEGNREKYEGQKAEKKLAGKS